MKTDRRTFVATLAAAGISHRGVAGQSDRAVGRSDLRERGMVPLSYVDGKPLRIGNDIQLLVDDTVVEDRWMLEINCSALPIPYQRPSDGIRVAILEAPDFKTRETQWEKAILGFGLEDCDNIVRDALDHPVTWKGNPDLSALRGRAVYLRFQMKKASLYAFRITP